MRQGGRTSPGDVPVPPPRTWQVGIPAWALVLALAAFGLASKIVDGGHSVADLTVDALTGGAYLACGYALRARRITPDMARLFVLASAAWFAEDLETSKIRVVFAIGTALSSAFDPLLAQIALSFPSGRLHTTLDRVLVASAYACSIGLSIVLVVVDPGPAHGTAPLTVSFLHVAGAADTIDRIQDIGGLLLTALILGRLIQRRRHLPAGFARRPEFLAVAVAGAVTYFVVGVHELLTIGVDFPGGVSDDFGSLTGVVLIMFPVVIAFGMFHADSLRIRVGELDRANLPAPELQAQLRLLLEDPDLEIRSDPPARRAPAPATTALVRGGRRVGTLVHGRALDDVPELLETVAQAAARSLASADGAVDVAARDAVLRLSPRQRQVLALLADGRSNETIAQRLAISVKTVEKHVRNIYEVLDLGPALHLNRRIGATLAWLDADLDQPPAAERLGPHEPTVQID